MKNLLIITAIATTMLASCSKEDPTIDPSTKNKNYLKVEVAGINSKAAKTSFAANDQINVFIAGTGYTPNVTPYKYNGSAWAATTAGTGIELTGTNATVYAFYPVGLTPGPTHLNPVLPIAIPVTDDLAASNAVDVMWATPVPNVNNKTSGVTNLATLSFNHALAKISFVIVKDATYPTDSGSGLLSQIVISSAGTKLVNAGTTNLATGVFTATNPVTGSLTYTPASAVNINQNGSSAVTAYALVAPVDYGTVNDIVLKMTIDGKQMTVTNFPSNPNWSAASKNYQYTITVKPTSLSLTSGSITDWTGTPSGTGITAQ